MRVFMLGWEFPPHISGGLGTACFGLTRGLDAVGVEVCFVLPKSVPVDTRSHVAVRSPRDLPKVPAPRKPAAPDKVLEKLFEHVDFRQVDAVLQAYGKPVTREEVLRIVETFRQTQQEFGGDLLAESEQAPTSAAPLPSGTLTPGAGTDYAGDLMAQVHRYARLAVELSNAENFDVIHAHDWMTYPAGMAVAAATGKPLVVHVHSTEFDRSGTNVNQQVYEIERAGMHAAKAVVCVSHLTRRIVLDRYEVPAEKTHVVYNAVEMPASGGDDHLRPIARDEKLVLFLGRVTMQKGPEYFLRAAKRVVERFKKVRFVMAGSGDMISQCIREAADLKLGRYVTFTGFLRGPDVDRVFEMADLYVMPSVSEPFGIAPLEALSHNVPVIISRQSGVSEVLTHVLKVDFWDIDEMANKILAVLQHPPLQRTLRKHGHIELGKLSWQDSARKLKEVYERVTGNQ